MTQVGASATRTQSSEFIVSHDAPTWTTLSTVTATNSGTTVTLSGTGASTVGLYPGMIVYITGSYSTTYTVSSITNATTFVISGGTPSWTSVSLKAVLLGNYVSAAGATNSGTTITVTSTAKLYTGMSVVVSAGIGAFPSNTYVSSITNSTTFVINNTPSTNLSTGAVITGNPNIYVNEYAINESNGSIGYMSATTGTPYIIPTTYILDNTNYIIGTGYMNIGTVSHTMIKADVQYVPI